MNKNKKQHRKLIIGDVLGGSVRLYKENFKQLFILNAIGVLVWLLSSSILRGREFIYDLFKLNYGSQIMLMIVGMIFSFVGMYYSLRLSIALALAIHDLYKGRKITLKATYNRSKEYVWKCVCTLLLLILMLIIPIRFISSSFIRFDASKGHILMLIVGCIIAVYIFVNFGFAFYVRIFRPGVSHYFTYSKSLIKNNFWRVVCTLAIPFIIQMPIVVSKRFIDGSKLDLIPRLIYNNTSPIINLLLGPFMLGVIVITYIKLDRK